MSRCTVSVVIPTYNPGWMLQEALISVIEQSFEDWELVIVDDGSRKDTSWVLDLDPRIRLLKSEHRGVSIARNIGVSASVGEFVAFLDQDDRWRPTKLERQLHQMTGESVFSYTAFDLIGTDGQSIGPGYGRAVTYTDMLAGELGILQSSTMVRRSALEAVGLYQPTYTMQQDLDLVLRLSRFGPSSFVASAEVDYRLHETNASRNYWLASQEHLGLLKLHRVEARATGDRKTVEAAALGARRVRRTYAHQAIDAARDAFRDDHPGEVPVALLHSLRLSPPVFARSATSWIGARLHRGDESSPAGRPGPTT